MTLPTFSALPRAFRCRASTVLPRVDHETEDARAGTARHRYFQRVTEISQGGKSLEDARFAALEEAPEADRAILELIPVATLQLQSVAAEVAIALNLETGRARELGRGIERQYQGVQPTEIVGTVDRLALLGSDAIYLGDYKGRAHRREPAEDEQLLAGAVTACHLLGRSAAEVEIIRIVDDEPVHRRARLEAFDLDSFESRLVELAGRIEADQAGYTTEHEIPLATTGDHCRYCGSVPYCPAKLALARAAVGGDSEELKRLSKEGAALITPENAARIYTLVHDAEDVLKTIKEAVADYARVTPFQLEDGRIYGVPPGAEKRDIPDGKKALAALKELFGEAANEAAKVEVTVSGFDKATRALLGGALKRGDLKAHAEKAEQILTARGLLRVIRGGVVRPFTKKGA
jgi:hypothetical protein